MLGPVEVLEVRIAELARARALGQVALEQGVRRVREEHLAAVAGVADPGRPVHVEADVAILGDHGLPGVDPHANADVRRLGPVVCRDAALGVGRRGDRLARPPEHPERRIALRVHLLAVVAAEGGPEDLLMVRHHARVPVAELVDEPGRPFDVGEEEGDGAGGELPCHWGEQRTRSGPALQADGAGPRGWFRTTPRPEPARASAAAWAATGATWACTSSSRPGASSSPAGARRG